MVILRSTKYVFYHYVTACKLTISEARAFFSHFALRQPQDKSSEVRAYREAFI